MDTGFDRPPRVKYMFKHGSRENETLIKPRQVVLADFGTAAYDGTVSARTVNSLEHMIRYYKSVHMDPLSPLVSPQVPENVQVLGTEKCRN